MLRRPRNNGIIVAMKISGTQILVSRYYPLLKEAREGFPGGTVVKNPPANAGDTGLSPDPGRSHMRGATKPVSHNY